MEPQSTASTTTATMSPEIVDGRRGWSKQETDAVIAQRVLLGHEGFASLVMCWDVAGKRVLDRRLVGDAAALVAWAQKWSGKGNCFIGRQPRVPGSETAIAAVTSFSLDLDPERPKGTAATDEQVTGALAIARRVVAMYPGGAVMSSGNGAQILYGWPAIKGADTDDFAAKCKAFTEEIRERVGPTPGYVFDDIHDAARIIKLVSTLSVKGDPRFHRVAHFVSAVPSVGQGAVIGRRIFALSTGKLETDRPPVDGYKEDDVVTAARALSRLGAHRGVEYGEWLRVGMALRGLGDAGLALWDNWSKRRGGYQTGACAEKWRTFEPAAPGEGVTIGTLVKWAADDGQGMGGGGTLRGGQEASTRTLGVGDYLASLPGRMSGEGAEIEMPTGIPELDAFGPLLARGHIFTVGAYTNVGKTTLASTIASSLARAGKRVLFFSTENTADEVMDRMVMALSGGWKGNRLEAAKAALSGLQIAISDSFTPDAASMERTVKDFKPDLLVFDYLQHSGTSTDHRVQEIDRFVKQFHDLLRQHHVAGLATAQLSRASTTEELALRHIRECGTIENESRAVLLMKRLNPNLTPEIYPVAAVLAKNKGRMGSCQLIVNAPIGRVEGMTGGTK